MIDKSNSEERHSQNNGHKPINESISSLIELATRVDERVQALMIKQQMLESKLNSQFETINDLTVRLKMLESRTTEFVFSKEQMSGNIHELQMKINFLDNSYKKQETRWGLIIGFLLQITGVIIVSYLLFKFGLQAPATP